MSDSLDWSTPDRGVDPSTYVDESGAEGDQAEDTPDDAEQAGDVGGSGDVDPASEPADGGPGEDIVDGDEPAEPNEPA